MRPRVLLPHIVFAVSFLCGAATLPLISREQDVRAQAPAKREAKENTAKGAESKTGAQLKTSVPGIDPKSIPSDAIALVTLFPKSIATEPGLKALPWEVVTANCIKFLGLDPVKIERIDLVVGNPMLNFPFAAVVTTADPIDESDLPATLFVEPEWQNEKNFRSRKVQGIPDAVMHLSGDKHLYLGKKAYIERLLKPGSKLGPLGNAVASLQPTDDLMVMAQLESLRAILQGFATSTADKLPGDLPKDLGVLASNVDSVDLRYSVKGYGTLKMLIKSKSGSVDQVQTSYQQTLKAGREMLMASLNSRPKDDLSSVEIASVKYVDRVSKKIEGLLQPKKAGDSLVVTVENATYIAAGTSIAGTLLPAVQSARGAAQRMQSSNNLKQLGLAALNYESAYQIMPRNIVDADGKPLLSWRVAILPFIEEAALYQQFHLDEPWDSEHNIQLADRVPIALKHPKSNAAPNTTVYLAVAGDGLGMFDAEKKVRMRDFLDGTSNTIIMVEASDENAKVWTAPEDFEPDQDNPIQGMRMDTGEGCNVLFCDGSVRFLAPSIDLKTLWSMFTRGGGEVITP